MGAVEVSVTFRPSLLKKMAEGNLNSKNFYGGPLKVVLFFFWLLGQEGKTNLLVPLKSYYTDNFLLHLRPALCAKPC